MSAPIQFDIPKDTSGWVQREPGDVIERAARVLFSWEQCDREQAKDVETQWLSRLSTKDRNEYRGLARALAAANLLASPVQEPGRSEGEIKAEALREFADTRGVNIGDEDDDWWRGYRQAQRECLQDALKAADQVAGTEGSKS